MPLCTEICRGGPCRQQLSFGVLITGHVSEFPWLLVRCRHYPGSSNGKEYACNAGDPGLIPGLGSSPEGIGYPLQYSLVSLVAQMVKNSPALWKTWIQSLGWEDPLQEGMATHSSLVWRIP